MALVILASVVVEAAACAHSGSPETTTTGASPAASTSSTPRRQRNGEVITADEITQGGNFSNAFGIIELLRPQWLRGRGAASPNDPTGEGTIPKAFVDDVPVGDLSNLRSIPALQVREIRFINARDATTRWGTGHMGGVIMVLTKK